ncbi:hypothetical protein CVT25_012739 [Psilocybe cyanescens]|uniref:N-acetyltransferase domain-containing protein n=1 Tax=Psilocybe cyanescens TaxID=93625 RepID=A0A409XSJ1_PSICY|nr:hypothetical protein CVT25_012739 [Psilocybe cyanescens]
MPSAFNVIDTQSDILILPLTARELPKVRDLHAKLLPVHYPPSFFLHLLVIPTRACYVAYSHNNPIGFISAAVHKPMARCFISDSSEDFPFVSSKFRDNLTLDLTKPRLEILTLGVLPSFQQRGLARRLVMSIVDGFKESCAMNALNSILIYANVSTTNNRALQFYERMGFLVSSDAALQFEWAWQHPHRSRHLRDANGNMFGSRAAKLVKKNVTIVRTMISTHPFNTWPLHVKIFTEEVANQWRAADADGRLPLPLGFTYTVELEGVDGQSGHPGSGRKGPISVDDAEFTSEILSKSRKIVDSGRALNCSICHEPIENFSTEPTKSGLCPFSTCEAVSHLDCLSHHFIKEQPEVTTMVPRGGHCVSCSNYILWGDIVRGCYRRLPPADPSGEHPDVVTDDVFVSDDDSEDQIKTPKAKRKKRSTSLEKRRKSAKQIGKANKGSQSSEGESFDFNNISSSSEGENPTSLKRTPGRPRKFIQISTPPVTPISPLTGNLVPQSPTQYDRKKRKGKERAMETAPDIESIYSNIALRSDSLSLSPMKRRPGRPRNNSPLPSSVKTSIIPSTGTKKKTATSITSKPRKLTGKKSSKTSSAESSLSSSEGEFFDFDNIASSSESEPSPVKARVGRPRKIVGFSAPRIPLAIIPSPKTRLRTPSPRIGTSVSSKERITGTSVVPHAPEVIDLTIFTASPDSSSSTGKGARGRPPKDRQVIGVADTSPDTCLSSGKKRPGRPKKNITSYSSQASSSNSGSSLAKKKTRGRPLKNRIGLVDKLSGSDGVSIDKDLGPPRKGVTDIPSNPASGLPSATKGVRGRPQKTIAKPTNDASDSGNRSSLPKNARGRPRKNTPSAPTVASGSVNILSSGEKSRGWPVKSCEPSMTSPLASPKLHKPLQQPDPILDPKRKYHHSAAPLQAPAGSNNMFGPIPAGSKLMTSADPQRALKPSSLSKQKSPISPSSRLEHGIEQAMSSLHIANVSKPLHNRRLQKENAKIIVLSD